MSGVTIVSLTMVSSKSATLGFKQTRACTQLSLSKKFLKR
jgi:hypothetical protein